VPRLSNPYVPISLREVFAQRCANHY